MKIVNFMMKGSESFGSRVGPKLFILLWSLIFLSLLMEYKLQKRIKEKQKFATPPFYFGMSLNSNIANISQNLLST
jgi:hypothetical protein